MLGPGLAPGSVSMTSVESDKAAERGKTPYAEVLVTVRSYLPGMVKYQLSSAIFLIIITVRGILLLMHRIRRNIILYILYKLFKEAFLTVNTNVK